MLSIRQVPSAWAPGWLPQTWRTCAEGQARSPLAHPEFLRRKSPLSLQVLQSFLSFCSLTFPPIFCVNTFFSGSCINARPLTQYHVLKGLVKRLPKALREFLNTPSKGARILLLDARRPWYIRDSCRRFHPPRLHLRQDKKRSRCQQGPEWLRFSR